LAPALLLVFDERGAFGAAGWAWCAAACAGRLALV